MKQNLMKKISKTKGITIIALVVTIVVLLILAGVSIGIVFNSDGLFNKASSSAGKYNQKKAEEALNLVLSDAKLKKYSPEGLIDEELDNMIRDIGGTIDPENPNKVTVKGYDFEINRDNLTVTSSLGENPNATLGGGAESEKKEPRLTLSATGGTIIYPNDGMFTITENTSNGELSISSSDDSIASASINGNQVTVIPKIIEEDEKEAIITVKSAETEKYKEQTVTYTAKIKRGGIVITPIPNTIQHDGNAYDAFSSVEVTPADAHLEYSLNNGAYQNEIPRITEVGEYTIAIRASKVGYETKEMSVTVTVLESVAKIGTAYYNTLQRAVNSVPTTNTNTTVVLLKDLTEDITIKENMNVILNLNSCTMTGTITNSGTTDISGGTVISEGQTITNQANGKITISGGTINSTGDIDTVLNSENAELIIIGGTLKSEVNTPLLNRGVAEINGTTIIEGKTAEKVGGIANYGVLNVKGGTLTSQSKTIINRTGGKATISGGTINGTGNNFTLSNAADAELIITGGTLTNEASAVLGNSGTTEISGTAKIEGKATGYVGISNTGVLNVKGGTLTSPANVINNQVGGKATISGGTITGTGSPTLYNKANAEITITGGTITNTSSNTIYNASEGKATISGGIINGTGNGYTVSNAANAELVITGGTLTSEASAVLGNSGTTEISGTARIEGKAENKVGISNTGVLNVKGGTLTSLTNAINNQAGGKATISGGTITGTGDFNTVYNNADAKITITGGTINGTGNAFTLSNASNAELVITGGTLTSEASAVLSNSGTTEISGTAKIEGKTAGYWILYNNTDGKVKIEGNVNFSGFTENSYGIGNDGNMEILGSTFHCYNTFLRNFSNGSVTFGGSASVITNPDSPASTGVIWSWGKFYATGGSISGGKSSCIWANTYEGSQVLVNISGGTFVSSTHSGSCTIGVGGSGGILNVSGGTVKNNGSGYGLVVQTECSGTVTGGNISSKNF